MSSEEWGRAEELAGERSKGLPRSGGSCGLAAWHGVLKSLVTRGRKAALPVRDLRGPLG